MASINIAKKYVNRKFGFITILQYFPGRREGAKTIPPKILYKCSCGAEHKVFIRTKFLKNPIAACKKCSIKQRSIHHGAGTLEYGSWNNMRYRCLNPNSQFYYRYGGRGIKICDRWLNSFDNFLKDMGFRPEPKEKYSLDRIDNNGNYEPSNCRWATASQQQNNKNRIMKQIKCLSCYETFEVRPTVNRKFCSSACYIISRTKTTIRLCDFCKIEFMPRRKSDKQKCCSPSCGAKNREKKAAKI